MMYRNTDADNKASPHAPYLVGEGLAMRHKGGKLASFVETRAKKTRDLLNNGLRGHKSMVSLGKLLHKLLVFV